MYKCFCTSVVCLRLPIFLWKLSKQLNFCQLLSKILGLIGQDGNTDDLQYNNTSIVM